MSDVKRYDWKWTGHTYGEIRECLDGDYVLASEFEALEAECERLRQSMSGLVMRHFAKQWRQAARDAELDQYLSTGIAQLEAERDALRAAPIAQTPADGLVEALEAVTHALVFRPSCQRGIVEQCRCRDCALVLSGTALAAHRAGGA